MLSWGVGVVWDSELGFVSCGVFDVIMIVAVMVYELVLVLLLVLFVCAMMSGMSFDGEAEGS